MNGLCWRGKRRSKTPEADEIALQGAPSAQDRESIGLGDTKRLWGNFGAKQGVKWRDAARTEAEGTEKDAQGRGAQAVAEQAAEALGTDDVGLA